VVNTVDPLGGSYFVESLTNEIEAAALDYFRRIDELGGVLRGIEQGFFQREIGEAAFHYQQQLERREKVMVGVNEFVSQEPIDIPILKIDPEIERSQIARVREVRARRDGTHVQLALDDLKRAAARDDNVMQHILAAVRAYATVGEISDAMKAEYGTYREPAIV
jgi:methylmalonyl-CoA mutase N-terminal domain/subunit